ncbi:MAG: acyl-CoA dehydratase activase-related protein, partial [Planctomycetota bacterium]|nr:acyl-CoA dehydratase activase-related protein [Planctomycetota bacterium]
WSKDQIAAAVLHSVRDNYLNKVVGGLHIGEHIYFQGATARNKALVAAFEVALGQAIKVSPFCHLTGALGMALLVLERVPPPERSRRFKGLQFADAHVTVETEVCDLCHNLCHLSLIHTDAETVAWGMKCGRDYSEKRYRPRKVATYDTWKARETWWAHAGEQPRPLVNAAVGRRVGILRSLGTYGYYPFWRVFLENLGCQAVLSPASSDALFKMGEEICPAEYCAPVLMSLGHARALLSEGRIDYLLVPHMLREPGPPGFTDAHFCCYVQSHPSLLRSLASLGLGERLLAPVVQLNAPVEAQIAALHHALGQPLGVDKQQIRRALAAARKTHDDFRAYCLALGAQAMARLEAENRLGIVCVGRPYNTTDPGLTLDLPRKIAELGYEVLFLDMLPYDFRDILPEHLNMYWHSGQKILAAAAYIARHKRLFAIYFTNFMCGPDSYILTYFKEIMAKAGKPYLCLQFDGHGADAGYLTRVEAALESFHSWSGIPRPGAAQAASSAVAPAIVGIL